MDCNAVDRADRSRSQPSVLIRTSALTHLRVNNHMARAGISPFTGLRSENFTGLRSENSTSLIRARSVNSRLRHPADTGSTSWRGAVARSLVADPGRRRASMCELSRFFDEATFQGGGSLLCPRARSRRRGRMPRGGKASGTKEKIPKRGARNMIDHRKELDLAIDVAQQQVLATECEQFVYEVILMSLKEKRADLGPTKLARPRSKRARQPSLAASK